MDRKDDEGGIVATVQLPPESYELTDMNVTRRSTTDTTTAAMDTRTTQQTPEQLRTEWIRFAALLYSFFLGGWNDGSTGPILPAIRRFYNVGFAEVSTLFIVTCLGAALGSFSIFYLLDKIGFGKVLALGAVLQAVAYVVQAAAPPFPLFITVSFINGMGMALQESTGNGYTASLKRNGARKMGLLHAVYGMGAFSAPFAATQFANMSGRKWAFFYIVSAGIAVSCTVVLSLIFRFKRQEELLKDTNTEHHAEELSADGIENRNLISHVLSLPLVHTLAFYILIYVGTEVTLGGWVVTFIIDERGGGPSSGYISSGFFGGLMLGRVLLLPINSWLGERRVIFLYAILTLALDIIIWRVRSLIGNAVAVSIVGALFGPMYPIVMHQAGLILPPRILAGAVGYIAGFGIVGGAIIPFVTGVLAARFQIAVMPIVVLVMTTIMACLWAIALRLNKARVD